MKKDHWIHSAWTRSLGTAVFSLVLTVFYDFLKNKPILSTVGAILDFELKVWWIIVGIMVLVILLFFWSRSKKTKQREESKPDFYRYRSDVFKKWRWTWNWEMNYAKHAWEISNLEAQCPKCGTTMSEYQGTITLSFSCPRCEHYVSDGDAEDPDKIRRLIFDNIKRKRKSQTD